jgi:hypothetical protein
MRLYLQILIVENGIVQLHRVLEHGYLTTDYCSYLHLMNQSVLLYNIELPLPNSFEEKKKKELKKKVWVK